MSAVVQEMSQGGLHQTNQSNEEYLPKTPAELPIDVPRLVTWLRMLFHLNLALTFAAVCAAVAFAPPTAPSAACLAKAVAC